MESNFQSPGDPAIQHCIATKHFLEPKSFDIQSPGQSILESLIKLRLDAFPTKNLKMMDAELSLYIELIREKITSRESNRKNSLTMVTIQLDFKIIYNIFFFAGSG